MQVADDAEPLELLEVAVDRARVGCASIVTESARSIPASPARALGVSDVAALKAASARVRCARS
jgi:hypothetical protein